uniref:putative lipase C4A8.10 n=1 Tax=Erigeron canadensis TaxID=72917 RepID=UPI001CB8EF56|nr:putative lipase C4A8.10 [Erigeron canadensis]XP_043614697.1 putative lipase C4A8.10 [Erigeron canadensis]
MESEKNLKGSKVELNDVKKPIRSGKLRIMDCSCFGSSDYDHPTVEKVDEDGNVDMKSSNSGGLKQHSPTHLVVMVNGLIGSAQNWRFAAKQFFKKYPKDLIVHCSQCNSALATLDGIDVMGSRLADEVRSVIERHPNLQKISFIGHSLGGLIARYAIAKLYTDDYTNQVCQLNGDCKSVASDDLSSEHVSNGKIAGLEPINFITVATPHLGSRGCKQVPMFCGLKGLEKVGFYTSGILKRTGRHVYLKDKPNGRPPLLVQMANDTEELKFISALQSFKRQVVYANVLSDHLVGWSTSSIRLQSELPKRKNLERSDRYPHILKEGAANMTNQEVSTNSHTNRHKSKTATMEETMIKGLSKVKWERVDVSFKGSKQRYFAHNTIQVNTPWMNSDGADVIQHMVDNFLV